MPAAVEFELETCSCRPVRPEWRVRARVPHMNGSGVCGLSQGVRTLASGTGRARGRASRVPFELQGLGGGADGRAAGGHGGGAGARGAQPDGVVLSPLRPVRAPPHPDGGVGGVSRGPGSEHRDLTGPRVGLEGRFHAFWRRFGYPTGRQVENGKNQGIKSSNYLQGCTICAFCSWIASASVVRKQRGNRLNSRESRSPHNHPHHGFSRAMSTLRSPALGGEPQTQRVEYAPRPSTNGS